MIATLLPPPALLLAFCAACLLSCMTPGPAVLRVTSDAMLYGARSAQASIFGILIGNTTYLLLAIAGLDIVLKLFPTLFFAIKIAGVAYLLFLAFGIIRTLFARHGSNSHETLTHAPDKGLALSQPTAKTLFVRSFLVQISNPKSLIYFSVILPAFIGANDNIALRMVVLALITHGVEWTVLSTYCALSGFISARAEHPRARMALSLASACALMAAASLIMMASL